MNNANATNKVRFMRRLCNLLKTFGVCVRDEERLKYETLPDGTWRRLCIKTGKKRLCDIRISWGQPRTIRYNPYAEVLAFFKNTHFACGVLKTKRNLLKGFVVSRFHDDWNSLREVEPKEALNIIKSMRRKKSFSFIDKDVVSEIVIKEL